MVKDILLRLGIDITGAKDGLQKGTKEFKEYEASVKKAKNETDEFLDAGTELPGVMGQASAGVKGLITSVRTLATTLLANPLGVIFTAVSVAVAGLVAIFKDFAPITDLIADKFARLQGAFRGLQTAVYNFTQGLGFSTEAINDQADAAERASKMLRDYEDNLSSFNLKQAQYEAQIDKLLKQARNKSISDKQANELIKEATRLQNIQIESLKENQKQETSILVERAKAAGATYKQILAIQKGASIESLNNVSNSADDELRALQENYTKRVQAVGSLEERREKINNAQSALDEKRKAKRDKEEADRVKAAEDEKARLEKQSKDNEERYKLEVARLAEIEKNERARKSSLLLSEREEYAAHIEDLKAIQNDELVSKQERLAAIEELNQKGVLSDQQAADAKVKISQAETQAKMQALDAYGSALSAAADLAGRDTAAGKALAVASSLISTYTAIAKNLAAFAGVPIPGYAIAQAVATGIAGFAAVKNILAVKVPNSGGGGGGGVSAPTMNLPQTRPSSGFTMLGNENPLRTISEGEKVKVFVTESDITNSQNKVSSIQAKATIG